MNSKDSKPVGKNPPTRDELNKIKEIFDALEKDNQAYDFLEPVDFVALGIEDYPTIVKNPMDVSTIKIINDIQLIWDNCKLYNMEGSDIYKMAIHCEKLVKRLMDKHFKTSTGSASKTNRRTTPQESKDEDEVEEIDAKDQLNLQEKIMITEKIRKLSNEGLAALVRLIQKECAVALEDIDNEKLQIRVDSIDRKTYDNIITLIDQFAKIKETSADALGKKVKA